jgi:hypothetical protein
MNGTIEGGKCNACHGYPPVRSMSNANGALGRIVNYSGARLQDYSGGGGVHDVEGHLPKAIRASAGWGTLGTGGSCVTCHPADHHNEGFSHFSTQYVQVEVDPKFKFDKTRSIIYNGQRASGTKTTGTCSNVSCHFQKSPNWSAEAYTQGH